LGRDCGHAETAAHSIRWREVDLARQPKGRHIKVRIVQPLRAQTPMSHQWIADRLRSSSYVSNLLTSIDSKLYGWLRSQPDWDPLRSDPRFEKIVASLAPKEASK
jgi:hypothetical protein